MKKLFMIIGLMLLLVSVTQAQFDTKNVQGSVTVDISDDSNTVEVDLYTVFGAIQGQTPRAMGFFTDSAMTSTTLTIKFYDSVADTFKVFEENNGTAYTFTIEAYRYYPLLPQYFGGMTKCEFEFGSSEAYDRVITFEGRIY